MLCEKSMKHPKAKTLKGRFTHYENNGYLYFNCKEDNDLQRHLIYSCLAELNNSYSKENNFYRTYLYLQEIDYKIGNIYAAIYPQDKMFYRVKILQILGFEKVLVCFMDYGNCEIISKSELAPLPHKISSIKPLAIICKIPNIQISLEKAFTKIIQEICVSDMEITVESQTYVTSTDEGRLNERNILHLISFDYNGCPIRDYLLKNKIAVNFDEIYNEISLWPEVVEKVDKTELEALVTGGTANPGSTSPSVSPQLDYTKTVIITSVNSSCDIFVHEFCKSVKSKLESLQSHINKTVDKFKSRTSDNMFNKRNIYLTQFSEDLLWYRCRISNFDSSNGFLVQYIDFGNTEYKNSLSELILLTREMGSDAVFLMEEEPIAQFCQLSPDLINLFPSSVNIRKYLTKNFVEPVKKLLITYNIIEEPLIVWVIKNISYHHQDLSELLEKQCILKDGPPNNRNTPSEASSHSIHNVADIKVAEYLLNGCPELQNDFFTTMDSNRQYLVTFVGGLKDIWIDIGDGQTKEMCDNLLAAVNQQQSANEVVIDYIYGLKYKTEDDKTVGVRCKIIDVLDNYIQVHLIDNGSTRKVRLDDLFNLTAEIIALPQQVLKFQFSDNLILSIDEEILLENLKSFLEGRYVRLIRDSLETNVLIDILFNNKSVLQTLISHKVLYTPDSDTWFQFPKSRNHVSIQANMHEIKAKKNPQSFHSI